MKNTGLKLIASLMFFTVVLVGLCLTSVQASSLYSAVNVSDAGTTGNTISQGNTSRVLGVAPDGKIYVVYHGTNGIRVARSTDRGQTFSPSVRITTGSFESEINVSSNGNIYVAWVENSIAKISKSTDGGLTFTTPTVVGTAGSSIHMATDSEYVYIIERNGNRFYSSSNNGSTFTSFTFNSSYAFSDVHVNPVSREVIVQKDNPTIVYSISSNHGVTFGPIVTPGASIFYSVGAVSAGPNGNYLFISGSGTAAARINLNTKAVANLTFGNSTTSQGRSLSADGFGNVVTGYVKNLDVYYAISNNLGTSFAAEKLVAAATVANAAINKTNGDIIFAYESSGKIYLSVFSGELTGYTPTLSTANLTFAAQEIGTSSAAQVVTMKNTGVTPLQINSITTTGNFSQTNTCGTSLASGSTCDVTVTFNPLSVGANAGSINISTNASANARVISLTGTGVDSNFPVSSLLVSGTNGLDGWYVDDVTMTLSATDIGSGLNRTEYSFNNGTTWTKYVQPVILNQSGIKTMLYRSVDEAGNIETSKTQVIKLDKTAPTATVAYSTTAPTNQDVMATITPNEDVTITNNGGSNSYTFTENGSFKFEFIDAAGNTGSVTATAANIDKVAPTATIGYNTTAPTNQDVIATITPSEDVTITNNGGSNNYTFTQNGSFTFNFVDAAGNIGTIVANVANIDKIVPTATVAYSNTAPTNQDVVAIITPSEDVTITNNGGSNSYTFTENGSFTFTFVDAVGNTGSVAANVTNIDKIAPTATVAYSTTAPTNQDVIATITASEDVTITNNGGSNHYTFAENGIFTFEFIDAAGNTGSVTATVANIDKIAPTATVTFNTTAPTRQDVIAAITASEDVTITNNGGSNSYTFAENGIFTFVFIDAAGNMGALTATVANIDKVAPTATVGYNTTAPTNQDVIATITPSEDVTITNNSGSKSYTFTENGSFKFEFIDTAGNTGSVTATVANIDKVPPTAIVGYSATAPTNQDVIATITASEDVTITNNSGSNHYTFAENGIFTFEFIDAAGNTGSVTATVANIDKIAPTATVAYNTTAATNQDVVATITPSEAVTITNNNGSNSYTFTENGSFTFTFVDAVGNTGSVVANVTNIDKIAPTATVVYSTAAPTNQDVIATITPSEDVTITNNSGSKSYTFTENGSFKFEFIDVAGNTGSVTVTVTNIDKVAPTATVAYNTTAPTNQDVIATITPSEDVVVTNNGGSNSYTFTENGSFTFNFVDAAGNSGSTTVTVANIDKIAPTATVAYNTTAATNQDVVATITPSEAVTITNNNGSNSYTFTENGSFTFTFVDAVGNTGSVVAIVTNIDKIAPTATVAYDITEPTNHNVVATITPSEAVTVTNNGDSNSYTFTQNGSFTFNFVDAAGNIGTIVATVVNIDKVAPTATVGYSTTAPTNQDVVAMITPSEDVTITNNGGSNSYTFAQNGSFSFNFVDAVGNTGTVITTVTNIDKIAPTATVAYDITAPTNHSVVATISPSEAVTVTNNGGSNSYTFTQNGSFTFNFVDAVGNTGSVVATVTNIDKTAPTLIITLNKNSLSPPNHKMVAIHATLVSQDNNPGPLSIVLTSITSNEPDNGKGDGNTINDIQGATIGTLDSDFMLRAERSGNGNGRIYTITYTITDAAGNQSTAISTVTVNKGSKDDDRDKHDDHENDGHENDGNGNNGHGNDGHGNDDN